MRTKLSLDIFVRFSPASGTYAHKEVKKMMDLLATFVMILLTLPVTAASILVIRDRFRKAS